MCCLHRDNVFTPFPRPIGSDGRLPLLSTAADGIHATDNKEGPHIINNYFGNLGASLPSASHPPLLPCYYHGPVLLLHAHVTLLHTEEPYQRTLHVLENFQIERHHLKALAPIF
jgi:hypothetical protein